MLDGTFNLENVTEINTDRKVCFSAVFGLLDEYFRDDILVYM